MNDENRPVVDLAVSVRMLGAGKVHDYCMVHGGLAGDGEKVCDNWSGKNPTCDIRPALIWNPTRGMGEDSVEYLIGADQIQVDSRLTLGFGTILKQLCITHSILLPDIAGLCRRSFDRTCDIHPVMVWPDAPLPSEEGGDDDA